LHPARLTHNRRGLAPRPQGGRSSSLLGKVSSFVAHKAGIASVWASHSTGLVEKGVPALTLALPQQRRLCDGGVVTTVDELFEAAVAAKEVGGGGRGEEWGGRTTSESSWVFNLNQLRAVADMKSHL
jgi:hypothetical protein